MVANFMLNGRPDDSALPQLMYKSLVNRRSCRPQRSGQSRLRRALCFPQTSWQPASATLPLGSVSLNIPSIHFSVTSHSRWQKPTPAVSRQRQNDIQYVHQFITMNNHLHSHLHFAKVSPTCMTVDCGSKCKCLLRTRADTGSVRR